MLVGSSANWSQAGGRIGGGLCESPSWEQLQGSGSARSPCNQTELYPNNHHRAIILLFLEPDAEIHTKQQAKLQESSPKESRECMILVVQHHDGEIFTDS